MHKYAYIKIANVFQIGVLVFINAQSLVIIEV